MKPPVVRMVFPNMQDMQDMLSTAADVLNKPKQVRCETWLHLKRNPTGTYPFDVADARHLPNCQMCATGLFDHVSHYAFIYHPEYDVFVYEAA